MEKNSKLNKNIINKRLKEIYNNEYKLIGEYINNKTETEFIHNICHKTYFTRPKYLLEQHGGKCPYCKNDIKIEHKKPRIIRSKKDLVKEIYKEVKDEYSYISGFNKNIEQSKEVEFIHNICGTKFKCKLKNFLKNDGRCPVCANKNRGKYLLKENYLTNLLKENKDYEWLEEYKGNNKIKHKIKHLVCGNEYYIKPNDFQQGYRCPHCSHTNKSSKYENELFNILNKKYKGKIIRNFRPKSNSYEIDLYFPDLKIGIEFNGYYWHSDKFVSSQHDINKLKYFLNKGINIYFINEIDYINKKDIVLNLIYNLLKLHNDKTKIYAKNCDIYENIETREQKEILNKNHINGYSKSNYSLGLYYKNKLVTLMTFSFNNNQLELSKFISDNNFIIIDDFKILLYYSKKKFNKKYKEIISQVDISLSRGNIYLENGFILDSITEPLYFYIDKKEQKKIININNENSSKYIKNYNCGNYIFRLPLN